MLSDNSTQIYVIMSGFFDAITYNQIENRIFYQTIKKRDKFLFRSFLHRKLTCEVGSDIIMALKTSSSAYTSKLHSIPNIIY